jgi:hypothetical protein
MKKTDYIAGAVTLVLPVPAYRANCTMEDSCAGAQDLDKIVSESEPSNNQPSIPYVKKNILCGHLSQLQ